LQEDGNPEDALSLWRGPPLAEFAYQRFAQADIARLEELHLVCLEERMERDLSGRRHPELVGELEGLVAEHPLRERLRAQLMLALYRSGRQAEALEAYQAARTALVEALGIEPTRSLRELEKAILQQDPSLDVVPVREPVGEMVEEARGAFVGREVELEQLVTGLDDAVAARGSPRPVFSLTRCQGRVMLTQPRLIASKRDGRAAPSSASSVFIRSGK